MGREWNDRLYRKLQNSIMMASERPRVSKLLVTDLKDDKHERSLIEVLSLDETEVITEFLVRLKRPKGELRYREEITFAAPLEVL